MAKDEVWKPIEGFEGLYEVSNFGRVKSLTRYKKIIKPLVTNVGYYQYQLWHKGVCRVASAHRLVAQAFIPNPEGKPIVNHIDENKLNNSVENLEWVTHVENCRYGTAIERRTKHFDYSKRKRNPKNQILACSKPVDQYTIDGAFVKRWNSATECYRATNISISCIRRVASGERKTAGGYVFKEVKK